MSRRFGFVFTVVAIVVAAIVLWFQQNLTTPLNVGPVPMVLEVSTGTSLQGLAQTLAERGVLAHPRSFSVLGRLTGKAGRIQAGEYEIQAGTTPLELLDQLVEGQVKLHSLTIVEGWTLWELMDALSAHSAIGQTLDSVDQSELAMMLGLESDHPEGQFSPDTYRFPRGTTDIAVLQQAHNLLRHKLAQAWESRRPDLPYYSPYELLILASIVERETALDEERPLVAGVFVRRLDRGMRLQTDPTVIYGLGESFDGNLTRKHLNTDTPYNTYTRRGLPPTPIGLPGEPSLLAAANPDQGRAIYFVATGDESGSHFFTETLEEHNSAVAKYLARLREQKN